MPPPLRCRLAVAKSPLPGFRALGINELPKSGSAEESGKPLSKQVWVQHQTLIPASSKGFSSTKTSSGSLLPVVSMMQTTDAFE
jgi:hypothetical protein